MISSRRSSRVAALEHEADDAERALTYAAVQDTQDFRQLHLYAEMGSGLEEAADALKRASLFAPEGALAACWEADAPCRLASTQYRPVHACLKAAPKRWERVLEFDAHGCFAAGATPIRAADRLVPGAQQEWR